MSGGLRPPILKFSLQVGDVWFCGFYPALPLNGGLWPGGYVRGVKSGLLLGSNTRTRSTTVTFLKSAALSLLFEGRCVGLRQSVFTSRRDGLDYCNALFLSSCANLTVIIDRLVIKSHPASNHTAQLRNVICRHFDWSLDPTQAHHIANSTMQCSTLYRTHVGETAEPSKCNTNLIL